jgi:hypothetical protein
VLRMRLLHGVISLWCAAGVKRWAGTLCAGLLGGLLLAGCSGARLAYKQLDVLLPWYFRDYVELDTGQRQQLERAIDSILVWHRESEVGRYAVFFRDLEREAASPLGRERIRAARMDLEVFWDDIVSRLVPDAAALLADLDDAQIEQIFARIVEGDREFTEKVLARSSAERIERRERTLRRQVERWVGNLDAAQRGMVASCARDMRAEPEGWLDSRQRWRQALREAISYRDDPARFTPRLERLLADGESFWEPEYRRRFDEDRERVLDLIADIDGSLSNDQRRRLRRQLDRWAGDFESIAREN